VHIFFRMHDGSCIAFFDLGDDVAALPSPNTPAWVNHIALRVQSPDDLRALKARLEQHGVEVLGIIDHDGYIHSIYFFDPNGLRVELTVEVALPRSCRASRAAHTRRCAAGMPRSARRGWHREESHERGACTAAACDAQGRHARWHADAG
jgi:hypothetical protein